MPEDTTILAIAVYLDWITRGRAYIQQHTEANYQQPYMPHELITSSDMQADDKLASYWGSTSNIHTRSTYTYMLIHLLGCHTTKLGGSDSIMDYSTSLQLHPRAQIQGRKTKYTSISTTQLDP
jgi:hypothetical protein